MTPLEKQISELVDYSGCVSGDCPHDKWADCAEHYKKIMLEFFKDQPEVRALVDSLKFCLNNFLDIPVEKAIPDGILTTGRIEAERALKAWGEFVGDKALRGADEK